MKIQIKTEDFRLSLPIPIPTRLIFSRPMVKLWLNMMKNASVYQEEETSADLGQFLQNIPEEAVYRLCDELCRIQKTHKGWDLVEVRSSSGDEVLIRL